jgi:hypothetical protein
MSGAWLVGSGGRGALASLGITCMVVSGLAQPGFLGGPSALSRTSSPVASFGRGSNLAAVSCVSATWCRAVGYSGPRTLVESWDGKSWSVVPTPGAGAASLNGVSCTSPDFCIAVGSSSTGGGPERALVESWDGRSWSVAPGTSLAPTPAALSGVACGSARSCTAVGNYGSSTLDELWDGATWSVVHSPTPGNYGGFSAVSCASVQSCTAVGNFSYGTGSAASTLPRALVESLRGRSVSVVAFSGPSVAHLYGVSCIARWCQAVGDYANTSGVARALTEAWNGARWSLVPTPVLPTAYLYGLDCTTTRFCVAVGQYSNSTSGLGPMSLLIEQWNGAAWLARR